MPNMPQPTAPPVLLELPPETQQLLRDLLASQARALAVEAQVADLQAKVAPVTLCDLVGGRRQSGVAGRCAPRPAVGGAHPGAPAQRAGSLRRQETGGAR